MTKLIVEGHKVTFSSRDAATAEMRAKTEDSFLRLLNSYVQSFAVRDAEFFASLPASHIEYLCQLAYEGPPVEGITGRSNQLAERIGAAHLEKIKSKGRGLYTLLTSVQTEKADPIVRKTMLKELLLHHIGRARRKEQIRPAGFRSRPHTYLDEECFCLIIPKKDIKGLVWDEVTQTSRFRCNSFSDAVKVEGINLTQGHPWQHLRLQTIKTWVSEVVDWNLQPKSTRCYYIRESRR